jgi:hypothetical protein
MEPDRERLERIADEYEGVDLSAEIEQAEYDDGVPAEPMVTTSLRLPKPVMDAVRVTAEARGIRPTTLMREWVQLQLIELSTAGEKVVPVSALLAFLAETATTRGADRQAS